MIPHLKIKDCVHSKMLSWRKRHRTYCSGEHKNMQATTRERWLVPPLGLTSECTSSLSQLPSRRVARSLCVMRSLKAALSTREGSAWFRAALTSSAMSWTRTHGHKFKIFCWEIQVNRIQFVWCIKFKTGYAKTTIIQSGVSSAIKSCCLF